MNEAAAQDAGNNLSFVDVKAALTRSELRESRELRSPRPRSLAVTVGIRSSVRQLRNCRHHTSTDGKFFISRLMGGMSVLRPCGTYSSKHKESLCHVAVQV